MIIVVGSRHRSIARWAPVALAPLALVYALAAIGVARRHGDITTYAGALPRRGRRARGSGPARRLCRPRDVRLLPGRPWGRSPRCRSVWFAPDWVGWQLGSGTVRTLAFATQAVGVAAVAHLVLSRGASGARRSRRYGRWLSWSRSGGVARLRPARRSVVLLLLRKQSAARRGPPRGGTRVGLGRRGSRAHRGGRGAGRDSRRRAPHTRGPTPSAADPPARAGALLCLWSLVRARSPLPRGTIRTAARSSSTFAGGAIAAAALAVAWCGRPRADGAAPRTLQRPAQATDSLEAGLVRATRDASLRVAFPLSGDDGWVDGDGEPVVLATREGDRATSLITREDQPIAAVLHDPASLDAVMLQQEIGPAARLAIENERLQRRRGRLASCDLAHADRRAGDAERRRLERDLHDGAQQRLVGLCVVLRRLARAASLPATRGGRRRSHPPSTTSASSPMGSFPPCWPTVGSPGAGALAEARTWRCAWGRPEERCPGRSRPRATSRRELRLAAARAGSRCAASAPGRDSHGGGRTPAPSTTA